jgi:uncharacterized protein (DUF1501 family)
MDSLTRRQFLLASTAVAGGALITGTAGLGLGQLLRMAFRDDAAESRSANRLVMVTLYGGNDGLNTVIPYADPVYHSMRPELAYQAEKVLPLDGSLGLNPMLPGLKGLWDQKQLAIVRGVGYPKPDRSHFRSMDIWQTASPATPINTGWLGRWLDGVNAPPEAAVSFEPVIPPLLVGEHRAGTCVHTNGLKLPAGISTEMLEALGRSEPSEPPMQARAASSYADLLHLDRMVREAEQATKPQDDDGIVDRATDTGGGNLLAAQLALVALCVEAGVPTRVYSVSLGGFDLHAAERPGHEILLKKLDAALTGFVTRMAKTEAGQRVTVVVYSEFGRRVRANASEGTDHGTAGPVFVLGAPVAGGFYGEQPSLSDLDNDDLKASMDFRDVFGTMLGSVLGADPAQFIKDHQVNPVPLLRGV